MYRLIAIISIILGSGSIATAQTPASLSPVENCQIIARINGQVVLASEVIWQVNIILEDNKDNIPPGKIDEVREMLMKNHLAGLVEIKLLYADFKRATAGRADMKQIEANLVEPFEENEVPRLMKMTRVDELEKLKVELLRLGTSLTERRTAFNERAIAGQWIKESIKIESVTHVDMLERYQEKLSQYDNPAQVRWEELMVMFSSHATRAEARLALAELGNQVWPQYAAAPNNPEPIFTDAAKRGSDGFTASEGGIREWTTEGALRDKQIDRALFSLPVATMSPILESELGYHVVRVIERKEAGRTPFGDVQEDLRKEIENEREDKATQEFITKLRSKGRVWTTFSGDTTAEAFLRSAAGGPQRR